ncbi:MAG: D-alanyl-D-alanine carboxypeptidase [Bacilli bacterium]|nr:D-alanyl-D-alanine carboxypeptidase [Bacilli bacterium]
MKKIILLLVILFSFIGIVKSENVNSSVNQDKDDGGLAKEARSAVMMEASTGKIIFEKNANEKLAMASMTKMMTLLIIMENIKNGNLKWDEKVVTSEHAASMGGSQIFLEVGEEMTVEDLVKGICIGSGNDAAVAMAERIAGTENDFVKMMNKKAQVLGLKDTNFVNSCGLDDDNHYSSANDMATIARELVKYDKILEFTGTYEDYLRKKSENSFWLVNTNKLVRYYPGVDGLKTGYTKAAGYCITTTAKKNNMRLITVVMGEPSSKIRNSETTAMLDYGFNTYKIDTLLSRKKVIATKRIIGGKEKKINIGASEDINILNTKNGVRRDVRYKVSINGIKAPLKKGDVVGNISVMENNKTVMNVSAVSLSDVKKANIFVVYIRGLLNMVKGTI